MKKITLNVDDAVAARLRAGAKEQRVSLAHYIRLVLLHGIKGADEYEAAMRKFFASNITIDIRKHGRPPAREEIYDRANWRK
jgi:hypothetical protein